MKYFIPFVMMCVAAAGIISPSCSSSGDQSEPGVLLMFVGSYAPADSDGIRVYAVDPVLGTARQLGAIPGIDNPSYLAVSADGTTIYSVGEGDFSTVNSISFCPESGDFYLNSSVPTAGGAPCYVAISPDSTHVVTANYNGGNISIFPLFPDGSLMGDVQVVNFTGQGPDSLRQTQPRPHCVTFTPDGRYLVVDDLGTDKMHLFPLHPEDNRLINVDEQTDVDILPMSGPRHLAYHPDGKYAYLINEISGYVTVLDYDSTGFSPKQYALADSLHAEGAADIAVTPDGRHLYASCRLKGDGVAVFDINPDDGTLTRVGYTPTGAHPRNIAITPSGKFLAVACRDTNCIEFYSINPSTGLLSPARMKVDMPKPVCVKFIRI